MTFWWGLCGMHDIFYDDVRDRCRFNVKDKHIPINNTELKMGIRNTLVLYFPTCKDPIWWGPYTVFHIAGYYSKHCLLFKFNDSSFDWLSPRSSLSPPWYSPKQCRSLWHQPFRISSDCHLYLSSSMMESKNLHLLKLCSFVSATVPFVSS